MLSCQGHFNVFFKLFILVIYYNMCYIDSMKQISVRIDEELHGKFEAFAKSEVRSINGQVLWMIQEAVKKYEEKQERATGTNGV